MTFTPQPQQDTPLSAEQRVRAFVTAQGRSILDMQLSDISAACGVSDATVVRYCRREGYKGIKDFKIALANRSQHGEASMVITGKESLPELKKALFSGCMEAIQTTADVLSDAALEQAVDVMISTDNLDVYASGGSVPIASYLRHQLIKLGVRTNVFSDRTSMMLSQSRLSHRNAVLAISYTGVTQDVVDAQMSAKRARATTICITGRADSPLAAVSDICLLATGQQFLGGNTYARLSQLAVVDMLYAGLAVKQKEG